jgi:hypothetical protein
MIISKDFNYEEKLKFIEMMQGIRPKILKSFLKSEDRYAWFYGIVKTSCNYKQFKFFVRNIGTSDIDLLVLHNPKLKKLKGKYLKTILDELNGIDINDILRNKKIEWK